MTSPKPATAGERRTTWGLLLIALGVSAWLVQHAASSARRASAAHGRDTSGLRHELFDLIPRGPELIVTVDVEALDAAAARELLRVGGAALLGLRDLCGFEPILSLRRVAFVMPFRSGATQSADFALIAETSLEPERVLRCAEAVVRQRGGQPARSHLGEFVSVRDQAKPVGEVAIRPDGLFVLSGGLYFRDVIDAANGSLAGGEVEALRTKLHLGMRRRLTPAQLTITLLPSAALPLPGVQALGLSLEVQREVQLRGFIGCTSLAGCVDASQLIERMKSELGRAPELSGLATLAVTQHDSQLELDGHLPREQLGALVAQLLSP